MSGCNLQAQWFVTVRAIVDRPLCVRTNEASSVSSLLRGIGSSAHLDSNLTTAIPGAAPTSIRGKMVQGILCGQAIAVAMADLLKNDQSLFVENERGRIGRLMRGVPT